MAGLPGNKARVNVGPPLSCKGPNIGSVLIWSPGPFRKPPPLSLQTLYPCEVTVPPLLKMLTPEVPAFRIVFPSSSELVRYRAPPAMLAELVLKVV
jgi:hypothetical protein